MPVWEFQLHWGIDPVARPPAELAFAAVCDINYQYHYDRWVNRRWLTLIQILSPLHDVAKRDLKTDEVCDVEYRCDFDLVKNVYVMKAELI